MLEQTRQERLLLPSPATAISQTRGSDLLLSLLVTGILFSVFVPLNFVLGTAVFWDQLTDLR